MSEWMSISEAEQDLLIANVIRFLMDGGELEAAAALLTCSAEVIQQLVDNYGSQEPGDYRILIKAPRAAYDVLSQNDNPIYKEVKRAVKAVLETSDISVRSLTISTLDSDWRGRFHDELNGGRVTNQGLGSERSKYYTEWRGLRFRSKSESRIAEALDKMGALDFPNCTARLGNPADRKNVEADFLVFYEGRYGILEVDGTPFHQVAAKDHDRDRLFKEYGIVMIERFTADECFGNPDEVVAKFLRLLMKNR